MSNNLTSTGACEYLHAGNGVDGMNIERIYIHPIPVRLWHWCNAIGFVLLIVTGFQIRYADLLSIMPMKTAISIHNIAGFVVIINYFLWLVFYIGSGQMINYIPDLKNSIAISLKQMKYYGYGYFVGLPNPHTITPNNKFNGPQKKAYLFIMLILLPAQMISGVLLWKIKDYSEYINILGGIKTIDTIHVLLFFIFTAFIFIHFYLATLGEKTTSHFKSMVTGYEEGHASD